MHKKNDVVKVDLNNPVFQRQWVDLDKTEASRVLATVKKLLQLNWDQLYRDQGLKWEKITSVAPPAGIDVLYSLRIAQARRATAYRDGNMLRFLTIEPDHDATYGKK
ncbi:hypothetical protein [Burkholderia anthina]|uniref:hypothetical protein n=1 Tax=Burkholderia anthina TaxID=179879 RepID=UPI0007568E7C|nr:hypothetical protein [Burkholderia anthina]KVH08856.1 hypothetical protein WS85_20530 [Burkholderia anthina]KVH10569.1 hypothetical protein WS84_13675 [Burkholderia anthina]KVM86692.1 hypothetical protein WT06_23645 [Burkholderia anthina]KVN51498.1 hypothetical protein WT13_33120 [Burkholderia anthina]KVX34317.1 hypothetical protein WT32_19190 [Burkholderia anthina]